MFKTPSHRVYRHIPVYYNPEKERQQERERNARAELGLAGGDEGTDFESRIRGKMRQRKHSLFADARKERNKSSFRVIFILVVLTILVYFMLASLKGWLQLIAN